MPQQYKARCSSQLKLWVFGEHFPKVSNIQARVKSKLEEHKREQNTIHGSTEHYVLGREQSMGFPV